MNHAAAADASPDDVFAANAHKVLTAVVVGSIGAGKTSLCRRLKALGDGSNPAFAGLHVIVVPEPVDTWSSCGALENFLSAPGRYAAMFQHMAFNSRIQLWVKTWRTAVADAVADPAISIVLVVLERSPKCDRLLFADQMYDDGIFTNEEYELYKLWFDYCNALAPSPVDLYIDVHTPFDETIARIEARANADPTRAAEKKYDPAYLRRSYDRQRRIFDERLYGEDAPILHVDGMQPFHVDAGVVHAIMTRIQAAGRRASLKRSADTTPRTPSPTPLGDEFAAFVRTEICRCRACLAS